MASSLEGITVLDLTRFLPAASGVLILADMGADVIRVETPQPEAKHLSRLMRSVKAEDEEKRMAYDCRYRNRRSIAINLKEEKGKAIFYKLARKADVVAIDFRPVVARQLGVDYDSVKKVKPDIIYSALSGYGQSGPYQDLAGFDPNFISIGGLLGVTGDINGNHVLPGVPVGDLSAGMLSAIGVLLAIITRSRTGKGQFVDTAVADCVAYLLGVRHGPFYFSEGATVKRGGRLPHVYPTKDKKYLSFAFGTPVYWESVCRALGMEEYSAYWEEIQALGLEDAMADPEKTRQRQKEAVGRLAAILLTRNRDEWFSVLSRAGAAVSPVYEMDEVFSDPQLVHRKMLMEVAHPRLGKVKQVGIPIKLSGTPGTIRRLAPLRGEHTGEIMASLGYTEAEIEDFKKERVI